MSIVKLLDFSENDAIITKEDRIMKRIAFTASIAIFILLGIVGCNNSTNDTSDPMMSIELSDISPVIENSSYFIDDEMADNSDTSDENESSKSQSIAPGTESSEYTEPSVEDSSELPKVESELDESEIEESKPSLEESEEDSSVPEISENESSVPESSEESEESQPTEEIEPDESEPPIPSEPEASEDTSSEAEPEPFDIDYWIEYARDYAESVGLILHESAVDCWDTPIIATPIRTNLKGDIESRLNRYAYIEEFEWVWIWAEPIGEDRYNLYIGYA